MLKDFDFDCKISFDELLRELMEDDLKNKDEKSYEILKNYFKKDIWYFVRHYGIKGNPFTEFYLSKISEDEKDIIQNSLSNIHSDLLNSLEYREKTWNKLINIINTQIEKQNTILLEISYLKEEDYQRLKVVTKDNISYNPFVILNYITLRDMANIIKVRNKNALEMHICTEYRHIILNIYMYLKYYENKDLSNKNDFVINQEEFDSIKKEIPEIDPYSPSYHWEKFRTLDALNEFKFPMKMKFPSYIALKNMINLE